MIRYVILFLIIIIVCLFVALFIMRNLYDKLEEEKMSIEEAYKQTLDKLNQTSIMLQKEREKEKVKKSYRSGSDSDFTSSLDVVSNLSKKRQNK